MLCDICAVGEKDNWENMWYQSSALLPSVTSALFMSSLILRKCWTCFSRVCQPVSMLKTFKTQTQKDYLNKQISVFVSLSYTIHFYLVPFFFLSDFALHIFSLVASYPFRDWLVSMVQLFFMFSSFIVWKEEKLHKFASVQKTGKKATQSPVSSLGDRK